MVFGRPVQTIYSALVEKKKHPLNCKVGKYMTHNKYKLGFSYSVGVIRSSSGSKYQTLTGNKNKEDSNCKDSNSVSGSFIQEQKLHTIMGKEVVAPLKDSDVHALLN